MEHTKWIAAKGICFALGLFFVSLDSTEASRLTALRSQVIELKELRLNQIAPDGVLAIIEADGSLEHRVYQPKINRKFHCAVPPRHSHFHSILTISLTLL